MNMKKVIIFALLFIIILPCFSAEEPTGAVSSPNFNVVLQRSGITEYYFTEFGNSTRLERVIFSNIYQEDGMYKSDAYLGFHYQIFENGNYTINIYFNPNYRYHEDINFVLQYSLKCKKFYYIKNITYFYIYNPKSMTSQKYFSEKRFSGLQVMKDNNEIAEKISPIVLSYSKAWQFLVNIEILFALKKFKVNNKEVHDDIINTLKETYPHFKKNKKNFNLFRRLGGVAYKIMLMFKF